MLGKEILGVEDLADIEGSGRWECWEKHAGISQPLFFEELQQYVFGIHAGEFLSQDAMEQIDIAGMNAVAVVDHGKMTEAFGMKTIDR